MPGFKRKRSIKFKRSNRRGIKRIAGLQSTYGHNQVPMKALEKDVFHRHSVHTTLLWDSVTAATVSAFRQAAAAQFFFFAFRLQDIGNVTQYSTLYGFHRVHSLKIKFTPRPLEVTAVAGTPLDYRTYVDTNIDFSFPSTPTLASMQQSANYVRHNPDARYTTFWRKFQPVADYAVWSSTQTTATLRHSVIPHGTWVNTASGDTTWAGLTVFVPSYGNADTAIAYDIDVEAVIDFKQTL